MTQFARNLAGIGLITGLMLGGCAGTGREAATQPSPQPIETDRSDATAAAPQPTAQQGARTLMPQEVNFKSVDGTTIDALYWPPVKAGAPGAVLMHMMGGSKADWSQFATLLQGASLAQSGSSAQATPRFGVLAIDFRGHGGSGGSSSDHTGMLGDAQAAMAYLQAMPDVDKTRIVMIGASIGSDAAVDECGEGCIGAISLSPGGFLDIPYNDALKKMGSKPVLCVAAADDTTSADTCNQGETVGLNDYQVQIYQGPAHGTALFGIKDQTPLLTDLLFAWLRGHVS